MKALTSINQYLWSYLLGFQYGKWQLWVVGMEWIQHCFRWCWNQPLVKWSLYSSKLMNIAGQFGWWYCKLIDWYCQMCYSSWHSHFTKLRSNTMVKPYLFWCLKYVYTKHYKTWENEAVIQQWIEYLRWSSQWKAVFSYYTSYPCIYIYIIIEDDPYETSVTSCAPWLKHGDFGY